MINDNWLDDAIFEHITNNPDKDSADIVTYFKLPANLILLSLEILEQQNKISRKHISGSRYGYSVINDGSSIC